MGRTRLSDDVLRLTIDTLERCRGNRSAAARLLRCSWQTIGNRLAVAEQRGLCVVLKPPAATPPATLADPHDVGDAIRSTEPVVRHVNPPDVIERLFDEHLPWAVRAAAKFYKQRQLPPNVIVDELQQAARIGLWEAARGWNEARGTAFKTYALCVLHGRMLDELRERDPVSRTDRLLRKRRIAVEDELGAGATRDAVQARLGWTDEQYLRSHRGVPLSLSQQHVLQTARREVTLLDDLAAAEVAAPIEKIANVHELLRGLAPDEFCVLYLYHWKRQTMKAIGGVLELSESRVSQLHAAVCERLRGVGRSQLVERVA